MDFLEDNEFDVFVLGHSLGLSDRVLLKAIFEHKHCKAIRLFHRDRKSDSDQFQRRIALSRHFDNKLEMRRKIVEYDSNDVMGQIE